MERKLTWHYVRGIPLAAVGFIGFLLSVLKTETLSPLVGGACRQILLAIPFVAPYYRGIPCLDFSLGYREWGPDAAKMAVFVGFLLWGAAELGLARKIQRLLLNAEGAIFRDRPTEFR